MGRAVNIAVINEKDGAPGWSLRKRMNFALYFLLLGPLVGTISIAFLFLLLRPYELGIIFISPVVLIFAYIFGSPQAALTGMLISYNSSISGKVTLWKLIGSFLIGWIFGNWLHFIILFNFIKTLAAQFNDINTSAFQIVEEGIIISFFPFFAGLIATMVLWVFRPKKWVGP